MIDMYGNDLRKTDSFGTPREGDMNKIHNNTAEFLCCGTIGIVEAAWVEGIVVTAKCPNPDCKQTRLFRMTVFEPEGWSKQWEAEDVTDDLR